ncbi:MAG: nucleoside hydrolase [Phycisphaerales bacterium]
MPREFWIDTDTASDDAVALVMALRSPDVRVAGISTVSGNMPLKQGTRNALYTAELCGCVVPVYPGEERPLTREPAHAQWFHGEDGMGNQNYPAPKRSPESTHAVDAFQKAAHDHPGLTLVTLGPLTNIAKAIQRDAAVIERVGRCVVMGGNPCCVGNVTPAAEYNIWCDPEAAAIVFGSGLKIEMVGWQLSTGKANLTEADIAHVRGLDAPLAHFAIDCNAHVMVANKTQTGDVGISLPDPTAMAVALAPSIAKRTSDHRVQIACADELTRGLTVVDQLNVSDDPRNIQTWEPVKDAPLCRIVWELDIPRWKSLLFDLLG